MTHPGQRATRPVPLRRLVATGLRLVRTFNLRDPSWVRPLPTVGIRMGRWVPAWAVHGFAAAIALGCIATVATARSQWILPSVLVLLIVLRPAGAPPTLFALWLGVQITTAEVSAHTLGASWLVFGFHVFAVLLTMTADVSPRTRIELRVFAAPLRRLVAIQALVQPVTWATMTLSAADVTVRWLPIVAVLCVGAASWALVRRVARPV